MIYNNYMINKKGVCVDFCVGNDTHLTYSKNKIQLMKAIRAEW